MVSSRSKPTPERERSRSFFLRKLPLEHETALFLLVSAFDVFMTYWLLRSGRFYESNPVAQYFLHHWGMRGMVYFKFSLVAFVCVITQIIAIQKTHTAQKVLRLATAIVAGVVIYSLVLMVRHG